MNAKVLKLLRGMGSVMDLAPSRDLRKIAPRATPAERMSGHFVRVGRSISRACGDFDNKDGTTARDKKQAA